MPVTAKSVQDLARYGLYAVKLYYPIFREGEPVSCSCGSPTCSAPGKHPVGQNWGKSATTDSEVIEDQWSRANWNVGIVLGVGHGIPADQAIIDIEDDTEDGRDLAEILFGDMKMPTYSSGKSLHRLFRWSPKLPDIQKLTVDGLEFRFGGGGKQTQSVSPPSMHYTGRQYEWVAGLGLDDIEIPEVPEHVMEWIHAKHVEHVSRKGSRTGVGAADSSKFKSASGLIGPGARHDSLLTYANYLWRLAFRLWGINGMEEQEAIDQVWMWLRGANDSVCDPPQDEADLQVLFESSMTFMRGEILREIEQKEKLETPPEPETIAADDDSLGAWLGRTGIRLRRDPSMDTEAESDARIDEWMCNWKMTNITKGDEELIELHIGESVIQMHPKEFASADTVARKVQADTEGRLILHRTWPLWSWKKIWSGGRNDTKGAKGITRGLMEYLINSSRIVHRDENSLEDQVQNIIDALAGSKTVLVDAWRRYSNGGQHVFEGRLKVTLGAAASLTDMKLPEDPHSGYYLEDGNMSLKLKFDEVNRRYRQSFGGNVNTTRISDCLKTLGFTYKRSRDGRWYARDEKYLE